MIALVLALIQSAFSAPRKLMTVKGERKGHRREARHERNIEQTCESINNSRLRNPPRWLTAAWCPEGNVLSQKLESASALAFNRDKTRAASNGRCTVGALCPFNSMTSAAAMH